MVMGQLQHLVLGHWINIWCHERGDREGFPCDSHQRSSGPDRDETGQGQQGRGGQQHNIHRRAVSTPAGPFLRFTSATKHSVRDAAAKSHAISVPVEEDRCFRCHNPECEEASCRLCKAKTHILMSYEEFKKETGLSER